MKRFLAVASNGGHLIQLLQLAPLFCNENSVLVTTAEMEIETFSSIERVIDINKSSNFKDILNSIFSAFRVTLKHRPSIIITTGAMPGLIFIFIGRLFFIKTIWIDSIANVDKLSASGKVAKVVATHCFTQWPHLETYNVKFIGRVI